jgi:spore coat polysaccharide biosynthesis protein SpsF
MGDKRVVAIVQARMSSTRLPGKVLLPLVQFVESECALSLAVLRAGHAFTVNQVVVATTTNPCDTAITDYCERRGWDYHRGSEEDVLGRVLRTAKKFEADVIVDITADCPLIDHRHIDTFVRGVISSGADYASNVTERLLPDGFDVQVYTRKALERVRKLKHNPEHTGWNIVEHWRRNPAVYRTAADFKVLGASVQTKYNRPGLALTLDTPEDYRLLIELLKRFQQSRQADTLYDIIHMPMEDYVDMLLVNRSLMKINKKVKRKEPELK